VIQVERLLVCYEQERHVKKMLLSNKPV